MHPRTKCKSNRSRTEESFQASNKSTINIGITHMREGVSQVAARRYHSMTFGVNLTWGIIKIIKVQVFQRTFACIDS